MQGEAGGQRDQCTIQAERQRILSVTMVSTINLTHQIFSSGWMTPWNHSHWRQERRENHGHNHKSLGAVCEFVLVCVYYRHVSQKDYISTNQILKHWCELLIPINVCRSELFAVRGGANEHQLIV